MYALGLLPDLGDRSDCAMAVVGRFLLDTTRRSGQGTVSCPLRWYFVGCDLDYAGLPTSRRSMSVASATLTCPWTIARYPASTASGSTPTAIASLRISS